MASLVDDLAAWLRTNPEGSAAQVDERRSIVANASVGHYAGRGAELASDLAAAGAPDEALDAAREGVYDDEQSALRDAAAASADDGASEAPPAPPNDPGAG